MVDSDRGILTGADRDFLQKDREERLQEYSRSAITQRWEAIQTRVYYGLQDLATLFHSLPDTKRREVFGRFERGIIFSKRSTLLRVSVAFLLLGVAEEENVDLDDESYYEDVFYHVVETVLHKVGFGPEEIDVEVTIEGWAHPDEGLAAGDLKTLPEDRLRYLLFDGQITSEEFAEATLESSGEGG